MNILMITNVFTPHVGGVARSVAAFSNAYRKQGHRVVVVAPETDGAEEKESDVVRVPAIQHFNGSDFSVVLPIPAVLSEFLNEFKPDIVHSHHPFLLGMTAIRIAHSRQIPLVFTNHTMYENYTHYVPGDSKTLKRFVIELATRYANIADHVFAPSESVADILRARGVSSRVSVLPTGVDTETFHPVETKDFRRCTDIPEDAFVIGHIGRLAPEKNLQFLAKAATCYMQANKNCYCLIGGEGPEQKIMSAIFQAHDVVDRVRFTGNLNQPELVWAYQCMDAFVFSSFSETQGMVLTEAMACSTPVVAIDAPGVREIVRDEVNGRLLDNPTVNEFADALAWLSNQDLSSKTLLGQQARKTAESLSIEQTALRSLDIYTALRDENEQHETAADMGGLTQLLRLIEAEVGIVRELASAATSALLFNAA